MLELAYRHEVTGITVIAFPLTADGLEIMSAAVFVYDLDARRRSGLLLCTVLWFGAAVSVAANAAVAKPDRDGAGVWLVVDRCLLCSRTQPGGDRAGR